MNKQDLLRTLPWQFSTFRVRRWTREDMDIRAAWPDYPVNYEAFNSTLRTQDATERDVRFRTAADNAHQLGITVDDGKHIAVGYFRLWDIDWDVKSVGCMGIRMHPDWCDKGHGTFLLRSIADMLFGMGFRAMTLDVSPGNPRAVRSYMKAGFVKVDEMVFDGHPFDIMRLENAGTARHSFRRSASHERG